MKEGSTAPDNRGATQAPPQQDSLERVGEQGKPELLLSPSLPSGSGAFFSFLKGVSVINRLWISVFANLFGCPNQCMFLLPIVTFGKKIRSLNTHYTKLRVLISVSASFIWCLLPTAVALRALR